MLAFYNSRYAKASCLESFSWRVEQDALKLAAYSCAPNMQVSCSAARRSDVRDEPGADAGVSTAPACRSGITETHFPHFNNAISDSGSTRALPIRIVQCRCGPVTRPVAPDSAMR